MHYCHLQHRTRKIIKLKTQSKMEKLNKNLAVVQSALKQLDGYQVEKLTIEDSFFYISRSALETCEMRLKKRLIVAQNAEKQNANAENES